MAQRRAPLQRIDAPDAKASNPATFIFLHGFGDDADGWTNIAQQFHAANKLPHLTWIFPNAPHNHEAMTQAWYTPTSFSPIPVGRSSAALGQEEEEEEDEDEEEILQSVEYICCLVDEEVKRGVDLKRIVIGGFSQGCAVSVVVGLAGRYKGQFGGIVGLSGYLAKGKKIRRERENYVRGQMKVFLGHGTKDMLVPMRVFRDTRARVGKTVGEEALEVHEYEGLGHATSGTEFRDMCDFLERIVPQ
ncbi:Acyl-protein thioesterase [Lachnellula willkommii]|uniref:Acyl-protein thioesterase 1 n=1 Tax=Lachnellula willkommii TaxID=215461 RepID=A0A559MNB9_9HELO|nr:Acyl-protein thioesterase [Lachnellula willkommii]